MFEERGLRLKAESYAKITIIKQKNQENSRDCTPWSLNICIKNEPYFPRGKRPQSLDRNNI